MSRNKRAMAARHDSQFINRLSLERCKAHISHMQAILHICDGRGEEMTEALSRMIHLLDIELSHQLKSFKVLPLAIMAASV